MLNIMEFTKQIHHNRVLKNGFTSETVQYISVDWGTGYLEMPKKDWDKLSQRKKNLIYSKVDGQPTDLRP